MYWSPKIECELIVCFCDLLDLYPPTTIFLFPLIISDQEKDTESIPTDQHDAQHPGHQEETGQPKDTPFEEEVEDDDENETCGFCIFMKGGGCRKEFIVSLKRFKSSFVFLNIQREFWKHDLLNDAGLEQMRGQ